MLKKDFLLFLHADWNQALSRLNDDLNKPSGSRADKLLRIRKANEWISYYATQLLDLHGVQA